MKKTSISILVAASLGLSGAAFAQFDLNLGGGQGVVAGQGVESSVAGAVFSFEQGSFATTINPDTLGASTLTINPNTVGASSTTTNPTTIGASSLTINPDTAGKVNNKWSNGGQLVRQEKDPTSTGGGNLAIGAISAGGGSTNDGATSRGGGSLALGAVSVGGSTRAVLAPNAASLKGTAGTSGGEGVAFGSKTDDLGQKYVRAASAGASLSGDLGWMEDMELVASVTGDTSSFLQLNSANAGAAIGAADVDVQQMAVSHMDITGFAYKKNGFDFGPL